MKYLVAVFFLLSSLFLVAQSEWTTSGTHIHNTNSDNVGIGTTSPGYKLTVRGGDIKSYNYDNNTGISIGAENTERPRIGFHVSDNNRRFKIELNGINSPGERLGFFTNNGGAWSETEIFTIGKSGNVGIGTTSPRAKVEIVDDGKSINSIEGYNGNLVIQANTGGRTTTSGAQLEFVIPANTDGSNQWGQARIVTVAGNTANSNATGKMILGTRRWQNKLGIGSNWYYGDDITIDGTGNVGIGTTEPQAKLAVNGDIFSKKVKVTQSGWADYVFHASYRLRPLSELEQYIQQHHHLPEVPTAAEVEKDGLDLGDNQATLLKKIEELTLYLIDQNKMLQQQQREIEVLKKQVQQCKN